MGGHEILQTSVRRQMAFCAVVACNDNMKGWSGAISFVTSAGCVSKTP